MRCALYLLFILLIGHSCSTEKKEHYDILIYNGNVIDLETGKVQKRDILISDGQIKKMLPAQSKTSFEVSEKSMRPTNTFFLVFGTIMFILGVAIP